jgi:hypothetical protein
MRIIERVAHIGGPLVDIDGSDRGAEENISSGIRLGSQRQQFLDYGIARGLRLGTLRRREHGGLQRNALAMA